MLTPLSLTPSLGFGDRLGLATPGHVAVIRGTGFALIFVQQWMRENPRTERAPQPVLDLALKSGRRWCNRRRPTGPACRINLRSIWIG